MLNCGDFVPNFLLKNQNGDLVSSENLKGSWYVLYFYPKDDTPGCTKESCDFRDNIEKFEIKNVKIFGISKDSVSSHEKFANKYSLNFSLLSDDEGKLCNDFGVIVEKNMYGKITKGIQRSTFLIDKYGKIAHAWKKVSVEGHIADVEKKVIELIQS